MVDANAVLTAAIALEGFEMIPRWKAHDFETIGGIELQEFTT